MAFLFISLFRGKRAKRGNGEFFKKIVFASFCVCVHWNLTMASFLIYCVAYRRFIYFRALRNTRKTSRTCLYNKIFWYVFKQVRRSLFFKKIVFGASLGSCLLKFNDSYVLFQFDGLFIGILYLYPRVSDRLLIKHEQIIFFWKWYLNRKNFIPRYSPIFTRRITSFRLSLGN